MENATGTSTDTYGELYDGTPPQEALNSERLLPVSTNVSWEETGVSLEQREARNGHSAFVVWLTGISGAGKSTVARCLQRIMFDAGYHVSVLDGDNVRHGLCGDLGFSLADRTENVRRNGHVSKLLYDTGQVVICAFISPYRRDRDFVRSLFPRGRFIEVYVKCSVQHCEGRDPKGLYKRARLGEVTEFTGVSSPYEEPLAAELTIETEHDDPDRSVQQIQSELEARGLWVSPPAGADAHL